VRGQKLRIVEVAAYWLFIICFPLLLLTSTIRCAANSLHFYEYAFDKYGISQVTKVEGAQLSEVARRLIDYFNSRVETPQINVVNEDGEEFELYHDYELVHLRDVKGLLQMDYRIQLASLAYIVVYSLLFLLWKKGRWQSLAKGITRGCALALALIAALGVASIFDFEQLFIQFHLISFSNPYWMLDPSKDYLIMLFPEDFWRDTAFLGGAAIAVEALFLGGLAWAVPFIYKRRKR
jgi:integral membrane protein (TIGR01906 family)